MALHVFVDGVKKLTIIPDITDAEYQQFGIINMNRRVVADLTEHPIRIEGFDLRPDMGQFIHFTWTNPPTAGEETQVTGITMHFGYDFTTRPIT